MPRPERPPDAEYYERERVKLFSQGDLFRDVPLAYPLPADELGFSMPESVALLYMPVTLHHAFLDGQRLSQLAYRGAQQLQRKLVWFYSGWLEEDLESFDPPMD